MICTPHPIFFSDKIKRNGMDGACSVGGGGESRVYSLGGET
jgi:hypothetical protein